MPDAAGLNSGNAPPCRDRRDSRRYNPPVFRSGGSAPRPDCPDAGAPPLRRDAWAGGKRPLRASPAKVPSAPDTGS